MMALESPRVQQTVIRKVLSSLNGKIEGNISFSRIVLRPFDAVHIEDLTVMDPQPCASGADTFFFAKRISATFSLKGLLSGGCLQIGKACVEDGFMHLAIERRGFPATNLERIFSIPTPDPGTEKNMGEIFEIHDVCVSDFRYRMTDLVSAFKYTGLGINWKDLDVKATVRGWMKFSGGTMKYVADHLEMQEKNGYRAYHLDAHGEVGLGKALVDDLHIVDPWSDVLFSRYSMEFGGPEGLQDYVNKTVMEATTIEGYLNLKTISYFSGVDFGDRIHLELERMHARGTVNDMTVHELVFHEKNSGSDGSLKTRILNAAVPGALELDSDIEKLDFTTSGLTGILNSLDVKADLSGYAPRERLRFRGKAKGPVDNLSFRGSIATSTGILKTDVRFSSRGNGGKSSRISCKAESKNLNLGDVLGVKPLGECTMALSAKARLGKGGPTVRLDSISIDRLGLFGRDFGLICGKGKLEDGIVEGSLESDDPKLKFCLDGLFQLPTGTQESRIKARMGVPLADLSALGLDNRGTTSKISFQADTDLSGVEKGYVCGTTILSGVTVEDDSGQESFGEAILESDFSEGLYRLNFFSPFANAAFAGNKGVKATIGDLKRLTIGKALPACISGGSSATEPESAQGSADISIDLFDTRKLFSYLLPGLYIANGTQFSLSMGNSTDCLLKSQRIAYGQNYVKDLSLETGVDENILKLRLEGGEIKAGGFVVNGNTIDVEAENNYALASIHSDSTTPGHGTADLFADILFSRKDADSLEIEVKPFNSSIILEGSKWDISDSRILFSGKDININDLAVSSGNQSILLDGWLSGSRRSTVRAMVSDIELALIDELLGKKLNMQGTINANAYLISPLGQDSDFDANVRIDDLVLGKRKLGNMEILGFWDKTGQRINFKAGNELDGKEPLKAEGFYRPSGKEVKLDAAFDNFNIAAAEPFLSGAVKDLRGNLSGNIRAEGRLDRLAISGEGNSLRDVSCRVGFTNVNYFADADFSIRDNELILDSMKISDEENGQGTVSGKFSFKGLKNPRLNAAVTLQDMAVINIPASPSGVYGKMYADANLTVRGPLSQLSVDGSVGTAKSGRINIPVNSAVATTSRDILSFKEKKVTVIEDPYDKLTEKIAKKLENKGIRLNLHARADDGTLAVIDISRATGNSAAIRGNGDVKITLNSSSNSMALSGDYTVTSGKYNFEIPGIVNKEFEVSPGSSIKLGGQIPDTELDLTAVYTVKTSLSTLMADTSSVASRRPVDCIIHIGNTLAQPDISFGVEVKDLDPTTQTMVDAALNTEDKIQRQFVALLVMGMFIPNDQGGIANGGNILYSNVGQVVSNQLNSIMQKLDIPVDLGLGYQQNTAGRDIFDVAISTQFFDNRVIVNGTLGNRRDGKISQSGSNMVGDVDVEVKIDKPGSLRLKLFSHSADSYTSFLDYSQRNGLGLSYQKEYNNFFEMIKNIFRPKAKRDKLEALSAEERKKMKTIEIAQ